MILHPAILALLLGGLLVNLLLFKAAQVGWQVMRHWRPESADERQLALERRCDLVTTLTHHALAFAMLSLPLFVFTAENLHPLFTGAMCATGTLNAAPYGWQVLFLKLWLFFLGGLWVIANQYDRQVETAPLLRLKFAALLLLAPLSVLDLLLTYVYFTGLRPKVITSCCGSLFSSGTDSLAAEIAGMPMVPGMALFFTALMLYAVTLVASLFVQKALLRYVVSILAGSFFVVGFVAIISFLSLYIYQLPTHHCPFDMLQRGYHFIGYPLYAGLFGTTLCGLAPGLLQLMGRLPGMSEVVQPAIRRWSIAAMLFLALFTVVAAWELFFSPLKML